MPGACTASGARRWAATSARGGPAISCSKGDGAVRLDVHRRAEDGKSSCLWPHTSKNLDSIPGSRLALRTPFPLAHAALDSEPPARGCLKTGGAIQRPGSPPTVQPRSIIWRPSVRSRPSRTKAFPGVAVSAPAGVAHLPAFQAASAKKADQSEALTTAALQLTFQ